LAVQPHKRIDITTQAHRAPKIIRMRMLVPQFADAVLADAGAKIGVRSEIKCYTENVFKNNGQSKIRPDGLGSAGRCRNDWKYCAIRNTSITPFSVSV
jgi:hypothetical protein